MHFDVIIIGGGHAGAEAAALASRAGARTLMLTQNLETIGQMSCNPAIGGIAKGTVVREVDALGGVMARATDMARIQFRMLNRSKGPAVWSPRAQCDRALYRRAVRQLLEVRPNLHFAQGTAASFVIREGRIAGIVTNEGLTIEARAVVLTAGTFLRGAIHVGLDPQVPAGRAGEAPSVEVSEAIAAHGITRERFKTGTPPRIDGRTVRFDGLTRQDGDVGTYWFSHFGRAVHPEQLPCYLAWAGAEVKEIIQRHLRESALYGGAISSRGPRYCPSVEDKIVRFPEAARHQVFLEPEGLGTDELYVNGLSTSLPAEVQLAFLRAVPGLEAVEMTRPGYAIEYDYFPPTQLHPTLESRALPGLFFAGQVNGTTGYEEAAGQGALAGLNAALLVRGEEQVVLSRDQAMVGVMVDDLVHRGVDEPYRLFTSRAEFRILLRQDNALRRLFPLASRLGLLDEAEVRSAEARLEAEDDAYRAAEGTALSPEQANPLLESAGGTPISEPMRIRELCRRPGVGVGALLAVSGSESDPEHAEWADIEIKYEGYLAKERSAAARLSELDELRLPDGIEYHAISTISWEAREKLAATKPISIGQAGRIPGVSPADLQNLAFAVLRQRT
ncbi:MAG TPA: tRNA uridine-5-carboxymethylaminomethyl(34) synthesis enzyme MnmG [Gemmatimonadales bacterium]|nr:tRNA uridine-5-carboxymethylaminomethyl(34) synthesis enzyme MnmG [Gemmatimonadales bacterium]HRZ08710.1 tRNA uridine-5-carboxymethylaminomethyl(34) synthesis enzyme MnmG [Gemmatimonadales bacterium]